MATPIAVSPNGAPANTTAAPNTTTLKQMLTELVKVEGITTAVVVSRDGFVIDGASNGNSLDLEAVGAVVSAGIGSNIAIGEILFRFEPSPLLLRGTSQFACINVSAVGSGASISVFHEHIETTVGFP